MTVKVTQADRAFRSRLLKHIADSIERPCSDGDMIEDRQDTIDLMLAEFRAAAEARGYAAAKAQAAGVARGRVKKFRVPQLSNELYEFYPPMSADTHSAYVKAFARDAVRSLEIATAIEAMEPTDEQA